MTTVEYTDHFEPASSLVEGVFYDRRDGTVVVDLNDRLYAYKDVPADAVDDLVGADSVGVEYNTRFKRNYGPGKYLGDYAEVDYTRVRDIGGEVPAGTPKNLTYASDAVVDGEPVNSTTAPTTHTYNLYVEAPATAAKRSHEVYFTVNGKSHSYLTDATSVDEAVNALNTVGKALGVDFKVEGVYVSFE